MSQHFIHMVGIPCTVLYIAVLLLCEVPPSPAVAVTVLLSLSLSLRVCVSVSSFVCPSIVDVISDDGIDDEDGGDD